jgi:hypothetical protein
VYESLLTNHRSRNALFLGRVGIDSGAVVSIHELETETEQNAGDENQRTRDI